MNKTDKPSILLVEDYPDTRTMLQLLLESAGFAVVAKHDGAEALEFLSNAIPDVILTDLMMPNVSGIELIQRVRANAMMAHVPIIAMTAYSSGPAEEARKAGAVAVLNKPVSFEKMSSAINDALRP